MRPVGDVMLARVIRRVPAASPNASMMRSVKGVGRRLMGNRGAPRRGCKVGRGMARIRDIAPVICRGFVNCEVRHAERPKGERRHADVCPLTAARAATISRAMLGAMQGKPGMIFTIEFFRIRLNDDAHATLDRLSVIVDDLDAAKVRARSLFETLEMPQKPDGLRILDESGNELFFWNHGEDDA